MKKALIVLISLYQRFISPLFSRSCVFHPTCSEYMKKSIEYNGFLGFLMGIKRILRCHPWQQPQIDFPEKR